MSTGNKQFGQWRDSNKGDMGGAAIVFLGLAICLVGSWFAILI